MDHEVQVLSDGVALPLVPFVEQLIGNTVSAIVGSLKGGEAAKEITIVVKVKKA